MVVKVDRAEWFVAEGKRLITDYPSDKYSKKDVNAELQIQSRKIRQ